MHFGATDEFSRVTAAIAQHGRDHLPEGFDLMMCKYPDWKPVNKSQWMSSLGFDTHSGMPAAHNNKMQHPGAGREVMHANSIKGNAAWAITRTETQAGQNPYALSYDETAVANITRNRHELKEISSVPFLPTSRTSMAFESKLKVNTNHLMDRLASAFVMQTGRSPHKQTKAQTTDQKSQSSFGEYARFEFNDNVGKKII